MAMATMTTTKFYLMEDGSVAIWNPTTGRIEPTKSPSADVLAELSDSDREMITNHAQMAAEIAQRNTYADGKLTLGQIKARVRAIERELNKIRREHRADRIDRVSRAFSNCFANPIQSDVDAFENAIATPWMDYRYWCDILKFKQQEQAAGFRI